VAEIRTQGQHNDSRMNIALIMTAVKHGAVALNYCEVTDLHKNEDGKLSGARVRDNLTGEEFNVRAKVRNIFYFPPSSCLHVRLP